MLVALIFFLGHIGNISNVSIVYYINFQQLSFNQNIKPHQLNYSHSVVFIIFNLSIMIRSAYSEDTLSVETNSPNLLAFLL